MSDLQTAKQRLIEAARLDEFTYQGVWEDVTAVLAALPDKHAMTKETPPAAVPAPFPYPELLHKALQAEFDKAPAAVPAPQRPTFSKSEYERRSARGDNVAPPDFAAVPAQPRYISDEASKGEYAKESLPQLAAVPAQPAELTGNPFVRAARLREQREAAQPAEPSTAALEAGVAAWSEKPHGNLLARARACYFAVVGAQPADRAEPAPLTDEQIDALADRYLGGYPTDTHVREFARAILATRSQP